MDPAIHLRRGEKIICTEGIILLPHILRYTTTDEYPDQSHWFEWKMDSASDMEFFREDGELNDFDIEYQIGVDLEEGGDSDVVEIE